MAAGAQRVGEERLPIGARVGRRDERVQVASSCFWNETRYGIRVFWNELDSPQHLTVLNPESAPGEITPSRPAARTSSEPAPANHCPTQSSAFLCLSLLTHHVPHCAALYSPHLLLKTPRSRPENAPAFFEQPRTARLLDPSRFSRNASVMFSKQTSLCSHSKERYSDFGN